MHRPLRVALIAPPYPLSEAPSPPLGLAYAAAACAQAGAEVAIFDYIVRRYTPEKLRRDLDSFEPDVVGATSVTMNFLAAADIIREAKRYDPSLVTMMGGPHVSYDVEGTLSRYPEVDLIVMGEGEKTLTELLPHIAEKGSWPKIKGIAFRRGKEIVKTPARPLIEDLDSLPFPARHLLPMSRYLALGYPVGIITSRGCPNQCIFCLGRRMVGAKVRPRSPSRVVDEIEELLGYGFTRINITDDTFTANKDRAKAICGEIKRRGAKFVWSAFSRVNTVDPEILAIMRDVGCDSISFGIESGNPEMLKRVKKGITVEQARAAIRYCKEAGIGAHASFIVGLPGENPETMNDSKKLAEELGIQYGYHMLSPFPGTTVREKIDEYDLEILTDDWNRYDANRAIVRTSSLSDAEMNRFLDDFLLAIEEAWKEVLKRYEDGTATPEETFKVDALSRMELMYKLLSEDVIEEVGPVSPNGREPVGELALKIAPLTRFGPDFIARALGPMAAAGHLKFETENGNTRWFWTHNKRVDRL
ncbi:MAG: radical SAM protein [Chloroflexi bacterium]|nr:radical SAM protein [Chloroflexota bacterium]